MFDSLTERLSQTLRHMTGRAQITEDNIQETLRAVRRALLEADVALPAVSDFIERVKKRAVGKEVSKSLSPGQQFIKIVRDELEELLGKDDLGKRKDALNLAAQRPVVILMAGLQGAGKTTTVAKLARYLKEQHKKAVLLASTDVYRPAAIKQLAILAEEVDAEWFPSTSEQKPVTIAKAAVNHAKVGLTDVVIIDTAGRLAIDDAMMAEIQAIHQAINPAETLFVVDAMTGQDAANTAQAFNEALPLTGVILSKADADSRGGAALSVRHITGKPIKFLGVGEKTSTLSAFNAERLASRMLGMGDMLSLIEDAERKLDKKKAKKLAKKIKKGNKFDLEDMREQLSQTKNMGGISGMLDKLPGMGAKLQAAQAQMDTQLFKKMEALINAMTITERRNPDLLNGSRKRRIIAGTGGTTMQDLSRLLKQYKQMGKMVKKMKTKKGAADIMRGLGGVLPPGSLPMGGGAKRR